MAKYTINRVPTASLLVAHTKLNTSKISKKYLRYFDEDLDVFRIFTAPDDGSNAEFVGNIAARAEVAKIKQALKVLNKPFLFSRLDGQKYLVYHCSKVEILPFV